MNKIFLLSIICLIYGCSNHKVLNIKSNSNILLKSQKYCYNLSNSMNKTKKIFKQSYLNKERQTTDFYYEYLPIDLISNIINLKKDCLKYIKISDLQIFRYPSSDTAQWRDVYYIEVVIDYNDKNYSLKNMGFKDYESTGWVYVFKFPKPENDIITETIQRSLVRIFTDIEDAITNKLTLKQRNAKKDKDRLETEKLMDKYIKTQKELEKTFENHKVKETIEK